MPHAFDGPRISRRRVLRAGVTGLATGVSVLGAGCSSLPPLGTEVKYGTVDVPATDAPTYRDWLPEPAAFPESTDAADGYDVTAFVPPETDEPDWARGGLPRTLVTATTDYVGFHLDDADLVLGLGPVSVLLGDVDRSAVDEILSRTPYDPTGSYAGYDVYARPDLERVVGVGPDAVVFGNGPAARQAVETAVDADRGEIPRYHEDDEDVATLTDGVGMRRWAWLWTGGIGRSTAEDIREDTVGWATAFDYREQSAYFVETWVFPRTYDPTAGSVKSALKQEGPRGGLAATEATAVDISVENRVVTIAMYLAPDVARNELADGTQPAPYTAWRAAYDADAERLTVRHDAGDPVETDQLTVNAPGLSVRAGDAGDVGELVEPGDELTVSTTDLGADDPVRLVFHDPNSPATTTLFTCELP